MVCLQHIGAFFIRPDTEISVAMVIGANALLAEIPEYLQPAFGRNRSADDAPAQLATGLPDRLTNAIRCSATHTVGLFIANGFCQFIVGLPDKFNRARP